VITVTVQVGWFTAEFRISSVAVGKGGVLEVVASAERRTLDAFPVEVNRQRQLLPDAPLVPCSYQASLYDLRNPPHCDAGEKRRPVWAEPGSAASLGRFRPVEEQE
jgi:hypothetical protein